MLRRSTSIVHRESGVSMMTPLLIPSFSSKGFGYSKTDDKAVVDKILGFAAQYITETCLVSAYDIAHGHIPPSSKLPVKPALMFVDSGGYEISEDKDLSTVIITLPEKKEWDVDMYAQVIKEWPDEQPAVFVSFDHPAQRFSLSEQISQARDLFRGENKHLHLLLIKPETADQDTLDSVLKSVSVAAESLSSFDLIGVTEKELGDSMLIRMGQIARLRQSLDSAKVDVPIHIFGALDPLSVMLYLVAGAEVFDGLTWLRYAYHDGMSAYIHNWATITQEVQTTYSFIEGHLLSHNITQLSKLQMGMRTFLRTSDYSKLPWHSSTVEKAWEALATELGLEE